MEGNRMATRIGIIRGREIRKNRDGAGNRVMLQVEMSNPDDIQTVEYVSLPGQDENPINGSRVYIIEVGSSYKIGIAVDDGIAPGMATGEKRVYSLNDAGAIQAFINLLKTGIIEVNGNADFAVRFTDLETAFNQLKSDFNTHTHAYTPGSQPPSATAVPVPQTTADMSGAKVDEVKLP
jgi:hypothetical protein